MPKGKLAAVSTVLIVLVIVSSVGIWYVAVREKEENMIENPANVNDVEILILESFPIQVNVIVHGEFPDICTEIAKVTTAREGPAFLVTITTRRPADAVCAQVITSFEKVISLDVAGLKKGTYPVDVNGVRSTFELQSDNILQDVSFLEGKVEIGPLCPVEPCNLTQDQAAQAYEARKIIICASDRSSIVEAVSLGHTGNYRISLPTGQYVVEIDHIGIDSSSDVPTTITIESGKTTRLDVRIDTGIR